ncbi:MAG: hypothetical protein F6K21_15295 [Symploca sp. SIO2D2]|nr:hypothetical protein [Symploca sp. SIO2D2]
MSKKAFTSMVATLLAITGFTIATPQPSLAQENEGVRFICNEDGTHPETRVPTPVTIARGPIGEIPVIYWIRSMGNITPEGRCFRVSYRFDNLHQKGALEYLTHGRMGGQPVICTADYNGGPCVHQLLTLLPQDNPIEVLEALLGVKNLATEAAFMSSAIRRINGRYYIDIPLLIDYRIGDL